MKTIHRHLYIIVTLLLIASGQGFGWGGETHKRITYLAWKYSGLPASSGMAIVPVVWNMDSVQQTLGLTGVDMQGFLLTLFADASGADFNINALDTIEASMTDSALFYQWGILPDDFDAPASAMKGASFGHMYIPAGGGFADGMCKFFFTKAVREYKAGNQRLAYGYLAMSAHYLEDCGFPPHNEKNYLDPGADIWQALYHSKTEAWIRDSTVWYSTFDATCDTFARSALPACDPVMAVHSLAWECTWYDQDFKDSAVKADKTDCIAITRKCLKAIVPRITGLFVAFKQKTM
jgi:hypothetical protein